MNTVKIGDEFENKSYDLIIRALNNKDLALIPEYCKVLKKPKYPSFRRKKGIIFDLAIEVTPPKSDKPTLLYLIECKSYSSTIPVDDINVFASYIGEIEGYATKGVVITNKKLQSGALEVLKSYGMMLIEVDEDDYNIVHYKNENVKFNNNDTQGLDDLIIHALENAILPGNIEGLQKLSIMQIDEIACKLLDKVYVAILENSLPTPLEKVIHFLKNVHNLSFILDDIKNVHGQDILGYYDSLKNTIYINNSIKDTPRYPLIVGHEIGHFVLHKNLKIHKTVYNNFKDVSFNFFQQKYVLHNPKNWIEWQANCFAASLIMPKQSLLIRLIMIQQQLGISKSGKIYLDEQLCNKHAYQIITTKLAEYFNVAKINVEYRLNDLKLLIKE